MKEYRFKCIMENKDKDINSYRNTLQEEHATLLVKFRKLSRRVNSKKDEGEEFVLKRMQLKAMSDYLDALLARMALVDLYFSEDDNSYFVKTAKIVDYTDE